MRATLLVSALLCACGAEEQETSCPQIDCVDTLSLHVVAGPWEEGHYTVDFTADGEPGRCEFDLDAGGKIPDVGCSGAVMQLRLSTNAVPVQSFEIWFESTPAQVDLTLKSEGVVLGQPASIRPSYEESELGDGICEQSCRNGKATVAL